MSQYDTLSVWFHQLKTDDLIHKGNGDNNRKDCDAESVFLQ